MAALSAVAAATVVTASATAASSSVTAKACFNSNCKESVEKPRKGWRRRTGEFAELCDRCASAYDDGKFCETFHLNASGWRCCESCGKQIHCGCIVSFHMFVLLDAGGIECITCAKKSFILTPNPAWPPPSLLLPLQPERIKDLSVKNWSPIAGSGPVPWRQAPSLFNGSPVQSELQPRVPVPVPVPVPIEFDVSGGLDRLRLNEKLSSSSSEKRKKEDSFERIANGSLRIGASEISGGGNSGTISEEQSTFSSNASKQSVAPNTSDFNLALPPLSKNGTNDISKVSGTPIQQHQSPPTEKTSYIQDSTVLHDAQVRNGRAKVDVRARNQLLPRYWPRITDEELQQISGDSNSVITPLFEKMLSASDAGRIGRLVLPKKCAEAYFPPISNPEGVPLEVQDLKGKEWVFQFRFWPNNNSRMYVLEGITPCIQSMQLQAGDVVTFSRIEPEGKLVMGCRKVSSASSDQQDAPVIGRPTIPATDHLGKKIQWVQCENCCKWRKVPADAILQSKWICSGNLWDPERSSCSAVQELSLEKLEDLLPTVGTAASKKMKAPKQDPDPVEALEGLDALANLALQEKLGLFPASRATTKHPRHKPGCSCIVCIQRPSGKGPKHKPYCPCVVCKSMQRRFNTLMLKKEKKQVENDLETSCQILRSDQSPEQVPNDHVDAVKLDKDKNAKGEVVACDEVV